MIDQVETAWRRARWALSPTRWATRLLGLPHSTGTGAEPGLLMVQIDGLSLRQLERAVAAGRMPFLRHLLEKEQHRLEPVYAGVPSTTPAFQAELFYGMHHAVPAFGFVDRARRADRARQLAGLR